MKERPCASGAHFYGNCKCIGARGLRHRREDEEAGIVRDWDWYYRADPYDILPVEKR